MKVKMKNGKQQTFVKWVGKGSRAKISIPIDAARSGDLEIQGFGNIFQVC